ncbi:MAG: BrnT family toxin [Deltaproteobacteria bacterium]|nr:BrnT family toxin [Deltaproteobacteria bacterium]
MKSLQFERDPNKAKVNETKHGVSFEEARSVFYDEKAVEFFDDENSEWEDRFLLLGISKKLRLIMVCHCYRVSDSIIRIISTRKATKNESKYYQR